MWVAPSNPMLVTIRDGRSQGLRLDQNSFQLVTNEPTAMRTEDFYRNDEKKIKSQYYEEIKQSIVKYTGATAVVILPGAGGQKKEEPIHLYCCS
jgi:hypothetical protein